MPKDGNTNGEPLKVEYLTHPLTQMVLPSCSTQITRLNMEDNPAHRGAIADEIMARLNRRC